MITKTVRLDTVERIKAFVNEVNQCPFEIDLMSGRYVINAKSIMGIFSLDISRPLEMRIYCDNPEDPVCVDLLQRLSPYIA